jgi:hypothetical protein
MQACDSSSDFSGTPGILKLWKNIRYARGGMLPNHSYEKEQQYALVHNLADGIFSKFKHFYCHDENMHTYPLSVVDHYII